MHILSLQLTERSQTDHTYDQEREDYECSQNTVLITILLFSLILLPNLLNSGDPSSFLPPPHLLQYKHPLLNDSSHTHTGEVLTFPLYSQCIACKLLHGTSHIT